MDQSPDPEIALFDQLRNDEGTVESEQLMVGHDEDRPVPVGRYEAHSLFAFAVLLRAEKDRTGQSALRSHPTHRRVLKHFGRWSLTVENRIARGVLYDIVFVA